MLKNRFTIFFIVFISVFSIDQYIKSIFVDGFMLEGDCISLILAYNKGVAFSMLSFLEDSLKYIQIGILIGLVGYLWFEKNIFFKYYIPIALILAGGGSNILDRFLHQGVVDYVYWHCGFDFAIFNYADIMINISVLTILVISYFNSKDS